jgi:hypothetical protein
MPPIVLVCQVIGNCLKYGTIERACIMSSWIDLIALLVTLLY